MNRGTAPDRTLLIVGFAAQLFAVDRATGQIRWHVSLGELAKAREVELAIADGVAIAATSIEIWFVDYATGGVYTRVPIVHAPDQQARSVMVVDGEHVFVTGDGAVTCYTTRGHLVWSQRFETIASGWGGSLMNVALGFPGNLRQADDVGRE